MTRRTRKYVWMVVTVVAGLVYARISHDWSLVAFYGGFAAVVVLVVGVGLPWIELAPDGDLRPSPQS